MLNITTLGALLGALVLSLTPTTVAPAASTPTHSANFTYGSTKPSATNTGAGILRANPTRVINGNVTLTGNQSLKDVIVHGTVSVKGTDNVVENCIITGDPKVNYTNSTWLVNTSAATRAIVRYNTIYMTKASNNVNGIGLRNVTAENNNISRVIDAFDIDAKTAGANVNTIIRGNYVHNMMFFAPSTGHQVTPTPASYNGPWKGQPWSHDDGIQVTSGSGLQVIGNTIVANWSSQVGSLPLPTITKELSCMMVNANKGVVANMNVRSNWFDGGEYCINAGGASTGSGTFVGNRFGSHIVGPSPTTTFTLVFDKAFHASVSGNVYEATGKPVEVRYF